MKVRIISLGIGSKYSGSRLDTIKVIIVIPRKVPLLKIKGQDDEE